MGEVVLIAWICGMRVLMGRVACRDRLAAANDSAVMGSPHSEPSNKESKDGNSVEDQ
jgi:hypothetical protein